MIKEKSYVATWCPICDKQVSIEERDTYRLIHIHKYHLEIVGKCLNNQKNGGFRISSNRISSRVTPVDSGSSKKNEPKKVYAYTSRGHVEIARREESLLPMPERSCADASYGRRQTDDLTHWSPSVFSVEIWKYHDESIRCPACGVKDVPIILKQQKFMSSRLTAFCLMGCWPFCFIPLMMRRDKSVRTLCPCCGHDYGICTEAESKLIACSPECASSRGKLSDFANSRTCHLRAKCGGSRMELGRRQNRGSPYDEYSRDDCVDDKRWDRRRDLDKSRASKAREQSESEGSSGAGTATGDFYARQVCCRECG